MAAVRPVGWPLVVGARFIVNGRLFGGSCKQRTVRRRAAGVAASSPVHGPDVDRQDFVRDDGDRRRGPCWLL